MKFDRTIMAACLWSGAGGIAVGAIVMSQVFGFMSPSTAEKLAEERSDTAVVAALAPGCAQRFRALPDAQARFAKLDATKGTYQAKDAFPPKLVTVPGEDYIDYDLARACEGLLLASPPSAAVPSVTGG